jgi:hypothetical protein
MTIRATLAALVLFVGLVGLGAARPSAPIEIPDPVGDAGCCVPDISHVQISNDARGILTVAVRIANRPQLLAGEYVGVYVDPAPNEPGDGYTFGLEFDGREVSYWVAGDDDWYEAPPLIDSDATYDGSTVTFRINPDDVEIEGDFRLIASASHEESEEFDDAPGEPGLRHRLDAPPLSVLADPRPSAPRVGKPWIVSMRVRGATSSGRVTCTASIGTRRLSARGSFFTINIVLTDAGVTLVRVKPQCLVTIPNGARGKVVKATIAVTQHGLTVRRVTQMRIR